MPLETILTLLAEYKYERDDARAGQLYRDLSKAIELLVLDKCRAIDKLEFYKRSHP